MAMRRTNHIVLLICCLIVILTSQVKGQKGIIRGFVFDKITGEAIILAHIYLDNTTIGSISGQDGYFSIGDVPAGKYQLISQSLGYKKNQQLAVVKPGQVENINIYLEKSDVQLDVAIISGRAMERKSRVQQPV